MGRGVRIAPLFLAAATVHAATFYVTIVGLGGQPEYEQKFAGWAKDLEKILSADKSAQVETLSGAGATKERVRAAFASLAQRATPQDALVVVLIGHGAYDGTEYRFALPGPDATAAELARMLDAVPAARQLVVNTSSASGASIEPLSSRKGRVVVTATKTGTEKNATVFARYWVEALRDPAADTDKNETISALEAFRYAERKTAGFYEGQKRLATEHPKLEGELASTFPLVRFGQTGAAFQDPAKRELLKRREDVELQIDQLKVQKAAIPADQYKKQLTALLVELAKIQEALDR